MCPQTARIAPSTLTAAFVTMPAATSMTPKARTIGHAVGAGRSTVSGVRCCASACELMSQSAFSHLFYRPMMYTTVNTTTHTASTKCQ
jgi:hypothetical protein